MKKQLLLYFVVLIFFVGCMKFNPKDYEEKLFKIINQFYYSYNIEDFNSLRTNSNINSFFVFNEYYLLFTLSYEEQYHPVSIEKDESLSRILKSKTNFGNFINYQLKSIKFYKILPSRGYTNVYIVDLETNYQNMKSEERFLLTFDVDEEIFNIVEFKIKNIQKK